MDEFLHDPFPSDEIESALKSLNKGKACVIDSILAEQL